MWVFRSLRPAAARVVGGIGVAVAVMLLLASLPTGLDAQEPLCPTCGPMLEVYGSPSSVNQAPGATNQTATFVVANHYEVGLTVTLSCSVQAPVASCGSVTPSSVFVAAESQENVTVQYNVAGTTGTGNVFLTGYHDDEELPNPGAQGFVQVNVQGPVAPGIVLRNRPDQLERSLCLTAGAGEAAWQCGDLLVAHGMPGYRTLGRDRALTLVYNSATADPRPTVAVHVTQPWGAQTPDSVYAELRVGLPGGAQTVRASATYQGWAPGPVTKQIVLSYDASSDGTWVYDYTLLVRNKYGSGPKDTTLTGQLIVINRVTTRFGRGWALAGVERISCVGPVAWPNCNMLWWAGDGTARLYTVIPDSLKWVAPVGAFRDTIRLDGSIFKRRLRHGVEVHYDDLGRHVKTVNRVGQETVFAWGASDSLVRVTLPPSGTGGVDSIIYSGGKVDYLRDPGGRVLNFTVSSGQLTSLLDPDNVSVAFGYDGAGRMTSRTNRKGHATRYEYGNGLRVTKSHVPYGATGADTARTTYDAWDERGLFIGTGGSGLAAVDSFQIRTKIDGPRTDVSDTAAFYVDKWGAPVRTVNAIGAVTQIKRQSTIYPALVTEMIYPNNRIVRMTYDTTVGRGNLKMVRDSTWHLAADVRLPTKATTYAYNATVLAPDSPTQVADVLGRTTTYAYNGMGILGSSTDPRGHVTEFAYDSTPASPTRGVVRLVTAKGVQTWEEQAGTGDDTLTADIPRDHVTRYGYDAKGNIDSVAAPHGVVTTYANDTFGRTYRSWDALNTVTELTFDALNRIIQQRQDTVPQANPFLITLASMACDATQVECADTTTRGFPTTGFPRYADTHFRQGPVGVDSVTGPLGATRRYVYDARAALEREKDEFQAAQIVIPNPAGLTLKTISRTNDTVFYAYDALGRTTAQWFKSRTMHSQNIPGDSTSYTYDLMSNVLEAKNSQGTITRTYYADGSVKSRIQTFPISGNDTLRYEYNATGQRSKLIHGPDTVTYTYSGTTGDLTTMQVKWGAPLSVTRTLTFTWDALGRRRQISYPNGMVVEYRYDKLGTLRRVKSRHPGTPPNGNNLYFTYIADAVDAHGRLLHQKSMCTASGGTPLGHSLCEGATLVPETMNRYNRFGAMVSSQVDANADSLAYDVAGNMIRRRLAGSIHWHTYTMTSNTNRLASDASTGASTLSFTYDANGARTLEDYAGGVQHPWKEYYYDGLGRTTGVKYWTDVQPFGVQPAGGTDQCRYDADGQMIKPCDNWSSFLAYDGANVIGVPGLANGTRATFIHGPGLDDPLLGVMRFQSDAKELMWVTDGAGRQYAVGGVGGHDPASVAPNIDFTGSSGYWGWQWVGGTKRSYGFSAGRQSPAGSAGAFSVFRNRLYDPATGRWTQEDPIGVAGGVNLYQFNNNNPVAYTDPFGLDPCKPSCTAVGAAIGLGVGATAGGVAAAACAGSTFGLCAVAAPALVNLGAAAGATLGAIVGAIVDMSESDDADAKPAARSEREAGRDIPDRRKPHRTEPSPSKREKHEDTRAPHKDKKRQHDTWRDNPNKRNPNR